MTTNQKSIFYETDEACENLPAMREIDRFLREAGYRPQKAGRSEGGYGCTVNRASYVRDNQNVFVIVNDAGPEAV
jgi:hypothetical protein